MAFGLDATGLLHVPQGNLIGPGLLGCHLPVPARACL